jgi:hypothetical protein
MTEMPIELRAFEPQQEEAIVWYSGRWYRLARDRRWYPQDFGTRQPAWMMDSGFIQVRETFSSFPGLVAALEEIIRVEARSAIAVRSRLRSFVEPETHDRLAAWRDQLPYLIYLYQGALDDIFASRGCTPQESRALVLETFKRLFLLGPMGGQEIEERLPLLAAAVFSDKG